MALSQAQRIEISGKMVSIPDANKATQTALVEQQPRTAKLLDLDLGNKSFVDQKTALINSYQAEFSRLDGNGRTQLTEQDVIDAADRKTGNFLFPNEPLVPLPSIPNGVWVHFVPFLLSYGLGKTKLETYTTVVKESDKIDAVTTLLTSIVTLYTHIQRVTGQYAYVDSGNDVIANLPALQTAMTNLIAAVNDWKAFLVASLPLINTTDTNATRAPQNTASVAALNAAVSAIDTWLARQTFDTSHGQSTVAGFNAYNPYLLAQTKLRDDSIAALNAAITARTTFIATRVGQLSTNLGTITQDLSSGAILTATGLYGERGRFIDVRLGVLSGSLSQYRATLKGEQALLSLIQGNNSALAVYQGIMIASKFAAPGNGTTFIDLISSAGVTVGASFYIASDTQPELQVVVRSVNGNKVEISAVIPSTYREAENARFYREI